MAKIPELCTLLRNFSAKFCKKWSMLHILRSRAARARHNVLTSSSFWPKTLILAARKWGKRSRGFAAHNDVEDVFTRSSTKSIILSKAKAFGQNWSTWAVVSQKGCRKISALLAGNSVPRGRQSRFNFLVEVRPRVS